MNGVIWVRVSTEMQTRGFSQDYQQRECDRIAKEKNIEIIRTFRVDETATRWWKRHDFREMTQYLRLHKGYYLLIYTIDRLLRNLEDYVIEIKPLIVENDVSLLWVETNQTIDKKSPSHVWAQLEHSIVDAAREGRKISERTFMGMEQKARAGWYPTMAPIGYLNVPVENEKPKIIVDEERSLLVIKAFELYASGKFSLSTLTTEINRRGLRTKKRRHRASSKITKHGLQSILRNPFFTGRFRWNKIIWPGKHPALISDQLFNQVQETLRTKNQNPKGDTKKWYPFKQFLKCGYCKSSITADEGWKNYVFYRCTKSKNPKCPQKGIRQEKIDKMFFEELGNFDYLSPEIINRIKEELISSSTENEAGIKKERKYWESQLTQKKNQQKLVYDDRVSGKIPFELCVEKVSELDGEIIYIKNQIETLEAGNRKYKEQGITVLELLKDFKNIYARQDWEGKSKILSVVVEKVYLKGDETLLTWRPPFDIIFTMSQLMQKETVVRKQEWGE